ncbi:unnamed protein product [Orchesella dallaii]|uniref:BTB domain-containing protein n=1 Tax=Orchesella dallaii TaxID=48710 RepID=A0ABP1QM03_9HEXA
MTKSSLNSFNFSWGSQQSHILEGLKSLAVGEISNAFLTDVTLACEGEYIEAHRLVLSLCSSFFKDLFNQNEKISDKAHGIVILSHVSAVNLRYILQFMYQGSVQVPQEHVDSFLEAGKMLKVEGLVCVTGVGIGLADKTSRVGGPSSSSPATVTAAAARPCPQSKKPSNVTPVTSIKRRRTSGPGGGVEDTVTPTGSGSISVRKEVHPNPINVKSEPSLRVATSFDDGDAADQLDAGGLMDDYGDAGGDSDFGGGGISADDEMTASFNPEPSTSNVDIKKSVVTPKREGGSTSIVGGGSRRRASGGRPKGAVWEHYDYDPCHQLSQCRYCDQQIRGAFATNMKRHLQRHHPFSYKTLLDREEELLAAKIKNIIQLE